MSTKLPKDSLILITGANGYIGSHVVDQLLALGYRVRGTVRSASKNAWVQSFFDKRHGAGRFELVEVPDVSAEGAFDEVVKGCSGFGHVASDMGGATEAKDLVPPMIEAVKRTIATAAREPSVRTFVLTSSSLAAVKPVPGKKFHVDQNSWNDDSVREAWADTYEDEGRRGMAIYGASKAQGERALWDWVAENKPEHLSVNTILPNANFGEILVPDQQRGSTANWVTGMYKPESFDRLAKIMDPQYFVHVVDTARLHAAVLTDTKYSGQRFLAFAEPFNWTRVLRTLRQITPDKKLPDDIKDELEDLSTVENGPALQVLTDVYGQKSWTSFENSVRDTVKSP